VRIWIDVTNSPHVAFFRPLIGELREQGADVAVTARAFAQTLELLAAGGIDHDVVGPPHGGRSILGKARAMAGRLQALRRWARGRRIDLAMSHASHELPLAARSLGIPSSYAFDYEYARVQHTLGCRAAGCVVVPRAIPAERLRPLGARDEKIRRYDGLKEEYYLGPFEPDPRVVTSLGLDASRVLAVVRTPPEVSLYHRHGSPLFEAVLRRLGEDDSLTAVVLARTPEQRAAIAALRLPSLVVPEQAVDAQSLVAASDFVVSAGGTMNREAAALGVPVFTTFAGRLGAVDETLIREGRLRLLRSVTELDPAKRATTAARIRRNPADLLPLLLDAGSSTGGE
jgi:predicted glycosyltransferase